MSLSVNQLELVQNIQKNRCVKSYKKLLYDYEPLIMSLSINFKQKYRQTPVEIEDIKNVISFHFYKLIIEYDNSRKKEFPSYIKEFLYYRTST